MPRDIIAQSEVQPASNVLATVEDDGRCGTLYLYEMRGDKMKPLGDVWVYNRASPTAKTKGPAPGSPPPECLGPLGVVEDPAACAWSFVWSDRGDALALARDGRLVLYVDLDAELLSDEGLHSRAVTTRPGPNSPYLPWDEDVYQYVVWSIRPLSSFDHSADLLTEASRGSGACHLELLPRPPGEIEYGKARNFFRKLKPKDALKHPIWIWTFDDEPGHDEETVKPVVSTDDVTPRLGQWVPSITFRAEGTDICGMGRYDHTHGTLSQLAVWQGDQWVGLDQAEGIEFPLTLTSVARIRGRSNVQFVCSGATDDMARCTEAFDDSGGAGVSTAEVSTLGADLEADRLETAMAAVDALTALSTDAAIAALSAAVTGHRDAHVRLRATFALGRIASAAAVPALAQALASDEEIAIRLRATFALQDTQSPAAVGPLARALCEDGHPLVRERAAIVLQLLGNADAAPALARAMSDPVVAVRHHAAYSLQCVTDTPEVASTVRADPLVEAAALGALEDESDFMRGRACIILEHVGGPGAVPALLEAAQDPDETVRQLALGALCQIRDERAVPLFLEALQPGKPSYGLGEVMAAVGAMRCREAVPALLAILQDRQSLSCAYAAEILGRIGNPAAIPALEAAAKDVNSRLRQSAEAALEAILGVRENGDA